MQDESQQHVITL